MTTKREERMEARSRSNYSKIIAMVLFLTVDLGLNSVLDYDLFNQVPVNSTSHLLLGLLGIQVVIQISIFVILFTAIADTFLFRVGLLGLLLKKFRLVLVMQPVYIGITLITGAFRIRHFGEGNSLNDIWRNPNYFQLSTAQKISKFSCVSLTPLLCYHHRGIYVILSYLTETIPFPFPHVLLSNFTPFQPLSCFSTSVAVIYYLLNMRATIKLGDPIYYNKGTWVALVRQVSCSVVDDFCPCLLLLVCCIRIY